MANGQIGPGEMGNGEEPFSGIFMVREQIKMACRDRPMIGLLIGKD